MKDYIKPKVLLLMIIILVIIGGSCFASDEDGANKIKTATSVQSSTTQEVLVENEGGNAIPAETKENVEKQKEDKKKQEEYKKEYEKQKKNAISKIKDALYEARVKAIEQEIIPMIKKIGLEKGFDFTEEQLKSISASILKDWETETEAEYKATQIIESLGLDVEYDLVHEYAEKAGKQVDEVILSAFDRALEPLNQEMNKVNDYLPGLGSVISGTLERLASNYASEKVKDMLGLTKKAADIAAEKAGENIKEQEKEKFKQKFNWEYEASKAATDAIYGTAVDLTNKFTNEANLYLKKILKDNLGDFGAMGGDHLIDTLTWWVDSVIDANVEKMKETWINTINEKYPTLSDKDKEDIKNAIDKSDDEIKKELKDQAHKEAEEAAKKTEEAFKKKMAKITQQAQIKISDAIARITEQYSKQLFDQLSQSLQVFEGNFGKVANACIGGLIKQIKNWFGQELYLSVYEYLRDFFSNGKIDMAFGWTWEGFHFDWNALLVDTLLGAIENDHLADLIGLTAQQIMKKGGLSAGPIPFEVYSKKFYLFGIVGGVLIPARDWGPMTIMASVPGLSPFQRMSSHDGTLYYAVEAPPFAHPMWGAPVVTESNIYYSPNALPGTMEAITSSTAIYSIAHTTEIGAGIPYLSDTGYILCEMDKNITEDSYVQRALSWAGMSGSQGKIYTGTKFNPTMDSIALNAEAAEFALFTIESALHGGFKNAIKDETTTAVAMYNRDSGVYILGPFKVNYIRSFSHEVIRGKVDFGAMIDMNIYDQNGNKISKGYWSFIWSDDSKKTRKAFDTNYQFPYPGEDFYIALMNYDGNDIQVISRIELEYKEMQIGVMFQTLTGRYKTGKWSPAQEKPKPVAWSPAPHPHPIAWQNTLTPIVIPTVSQPLISVQFAKKYYLHHTQTINLHRKDTHGGYETAEFTTTSSVSTTGYKNVSTVWGDIGNSELADTLKELDDKTAKENQYSSTGSTFFDSMGQVYNIYHDANNKTPLLTATQAVLGNYGLMDEAAFVGRLGLAYDAFVDKSATDFDKFAAAVIILDKDQQYSKYVQAMAAVSDLIEANNAMKKDQDGNIIDQKAMSKVGNAFRAVSKTAQIFGVNSEYLNLVNGVSNILTNDKLTEKQKEKILENTMIVCGAGDEVAIAKKLKEVAGSDQDVNNRVAEAVNLITNDKYGKYALKALDLVNRNIKKEDKNDEQDEKNKENKENKGINWLNVITTTGDIINGLGSISKEILGDAEKDIKTGFNIGEGIAKIEQEKEATNSTITLNEVIDVFGANVKEVGEAKEKAEELKQTADEIKKGAEQTIDNLKKAGEKLENLGEITKGINDEGLSIDTLKKVQDGIENGGKSIAEAAIDAYRKDSKIGGKVIDKTLNAMSDLNIQDTNTLVNAMLKSSNLEELSDLVEGYVERKSLRTEEEQKEAAQRPFEETLEELATLNDATPYIEYNPKFTITNIERPNEVYWSNDHEMGLTIGVAGCVWKDGHTGLENDYNGLRDANANGELEMGVEGVKITLIDRKTGQIGKMYNESGRKIDATTYTDEGGYYHIEKVLVGEYDVEFEYDGQNYKTSTLLEGGDVPDYIVDPDNEKYDNNSKAIEDPSERIEFNDRFNEIVNGYAIGKDGTKTPLAYTKIGGESKLITLDSDGHVLPQFAMHARTSTNGLTYPIDDNMTLEDHDVTLILNGNKFTFYSAGEYMYHINLGLVERSKIDLAVTQDVYTAVNTINQKQERYIYNARGILSIFDSRLKVTDSYKAFRYTRELYKADWQFRIEDYKVNDLNRLDRYENDKTDEIENIQRIKTVDMEEKTFITYKITIKNQSILQSATINELADYFDSTYNLVTKDTYLDIQDEEGVPHSTLVAKQSYYQKSNGEIEKLTWTTNGKYDTDLYPGFNSIYTTGLEDIMLRTKEEIDVYITFEVDKGRNDEILLGEKRNIVDISNYSSFEIGTTDKTFPEGLIDKDSEPGHANPWMPQDYEDAVDEAPVIEIKLYETDGRVIDGYVWDDNRTTKISGSEKNTGNSQKQLIGNGIKQENEDVVSGVRVQLIEKIDDPRTGAEYEYVWKEMYTSEDNYRYVQHEGAARNAGGNVADYGSITADTTLGSVQKGQYKFNEYIAGNFIVRFIYGDTPKTYLTDEKENNNGKGQNPVSYNGHDYKSTRYQIGTNINKKWYDLDDTAHINTRMSDAKDDEARRLKVINYSTTIENDKAEVLASFDARTDKNSYGDDRNYYDETKHKELRNNTWMFADTARFNVQIEYNKTADNGLEKPSYRIKNIDFGLEERPETKIELNKEIVGIKITLASGEVIIDTAGGINKNVNWVSQKKNETKGITYKRETKKYTYDQGQVHVYMDEEIMQGAKLQVDYLITIKNNSDTDYVGEDGSLGTAYYQGRYSTNDKIVTTKVDKIIDYVDNSMVFRKIDSQPWDLVENMKEFLTDDLKKEVEEKEELQKEIEEQNYGTWIEAQMRVHGEDYVVQHLNDKFSEEEYKKLNKTQLQNDVISTITKLDNGQILQNMKEIGYVNPSLEFVQTKTGKVEIQPITQVIVTKVTEGTELKPGQTTTVDLTLVKTLSSQDEADALSYRNVAEILQLSNTVGRRDMDAIPGNQDPDIRQSDDVLPEEYDADVTEKIIITPPTGENKAQYYILGVIIVLILVGGIIVIKKKVIDEK